VTVPLLECRGVSAEVARASGTRETLFQNVSFVLGGGELTLLGGPTGSGKTTLLGILGGILRPRQGEVLADGVGVSRFVGEHRDLWRREVGLALQSPEMLNWATVFENAAVPLVPRRMGTFAIRDRVEEELARLELGEHAAERAARLSGGERQRLELARALVGKPRFLLVDEPTAHQDDRGAALITKRLREAAHEGSVVLIATHDPRLWTEGLADRRFEIQSRQLVERK